MLNADFDEAYSLAGNEVNFNSIAGPRHAFNIEPRQVMATWETDLSIDNLDRDYDAAAATAEYLAKQHDGSAVDATLPRKLWPPETGDDHHPAIPTLELAWTTVSAGEVIEFLLDAADAHWPSAVPFCFSDSEPFMCEAPGDRGALLALAQAQRDKKRGSLCWLCHSPSLYGIASWSAGAIKLTLGIDRVEFQRNRTHAMEFVNTVSESLGAMPQATTCSVEIRSGTWFGSDDGQPYVLDG